MDTNWNDSLPIYRQLRDRVVAMILEGVLKEGDPLPSVRNVAAEFRLNPRTRREPQVSHRAKNIGGQPPSVPGEGRASAHASA